MEEMLKNVRTVAVEDARGDMLLHFLGASSGISGLSQSKAGTGSHL